MALFKKLSPLLLVVLLSSFAIFPFFQPGFFPMHDDTQPARIYEMAKSLQNGMFPVRWVLDLGYGYGYPIFNFYAPLAYYFGSIFILIGLNVVVATKIMMVFGIMLSGFSMYLFTKDIWGKLGGLISALFYMYVPYHAINIYVRGDVSEFWAYAFFPFVFHSLNLIYKKPNFKYAALGAFGYAAIILSHNLSAAMISPVIVVYALGLCFVSYKKNKSNRIFLYFSVFALGLLISCFYWLPALLEMKDTNVMSQFIGGSDFRKNFVCPAQLWNSPWGFGGSVVGCVDGMSFMLGKLNIVVSLLSALIIFIFILLKRITLKVAFAIGSIFGLILSIILILEISKLFWETVPNMTYFQYPWRFLNLAAFFMAILSGCLIWEIGEIFKRKIELLAVLVMLLLIFIFNVKFFVPQKIIAVSAENYTSESALKWKISKISDEYLPKSISKPKSAQEALRNKIKFSFKETQLERISNILSLSGIFILILGIIISRKRASEL